MTRREIDYLLRALRLERNRLIEEKIAIRDGGGDPVDTRRDLIEINRINEEVLRALNDIKASEATQRR